MVALLMHKMVNAMIIKHSLPSLYVTVRTEKSRSGAPNGSVPQNICSSGKFLLAGRFGQNNMSLEIGKLWVSEVI